MLAPISVRPINARPSQISLPQISRGGISSLFGGLFGNTTPPVIRQTASGPVNVQSLSAYPVYSRSGISQNR
jgi:hypothetical protein